MEYLFANPDFTYAIQELAGKLEGEKGSFLPFKCDIKNEDEILAMFAEIKKQYGGLDVCINNAGLAHQANLLDGETEKWRDIFEVHGNPTFLLVSPVDINLL